MAMWEVIALDIQQVDEWAPGVMPRLALALTFSTIMIGMFGLRSARVCAGTCREQTADELCRLCSSMLHATVWTPYPPFNVLQTWPGMRLYRTCGCIFLAL